MEQTYLVEDFILPTVAMGDIGNYESIPKVHRWVTCSEGEAEEAKAKGEPVLNLYVGCWRGLLG